MNNKYRLIFIIIFIIFILITSNLTSLTAQNKKNFSKLQDLVNNNISNTNIINTTLSDVKILYPRPFIPIIVEKNGNFTIEFISKNFDSVYAYLSTSYEPIVDEIELEINNIKKSEGIWYAEVIIPQDTPEELYNLTILIEKNGKFSSCNRPRSVSIKNEISNNFTFIHLTDFHIGDPRGLKENIKQTIGWKAAKKCIEEINLINPDFVIITGDLVFGQILPFEYIWEYKECYEILQMFQVPTYLCPGNHDGYIQTGQDGFKYWEKYFGPLSYSFNYGDHHFTSINSYDWPKISRFGISFIVFNWGGYIQKQQLEWIEKDLKDNNEKLNFIMLHHNPLWDTKNDSLLKNGYEGRDELLSLINENNVDAVFAGHVHYDNVTIKNNTIFITTTTATSGTESDSYWGYRFIKVQDSQIESYNYKEPKYSIPSYRLNLTYIDPNIALVENDLEINITVHLKFILPNRNYNVENGEIIQIRESHDLVEIYVLTEIHKESEKTIILY
jgi:Icc-related predicted phosphoesterase